MQLDADEGGDPFHKPAPQPSAPKTSISDQPASKSADPAENDNEAAAIATVEQEA
jgi:hypothetical protein